MPKYSEKFINERNKIYQENNKLLDMLYIVYHGNFIQGQAKEICFKYDYKREVKKDGETKLESYNENTFNNLFRKLVKYNLIDRKRFKDTNNLCVSFKKGLISMILKIPQDKISANRNAMNNSTNEVFTLSLFKGYFFLKYYKKAKESGVTVSNLNYTDILLLFKGNNTNIYLTDKDILKFYTIIEMFSDGNEYMPQSRQLQEITKKVDNIKNVREIKNGNKDIEIYRQKRSPKSRGELFESYDLINLKRRKIFLNGFYDTGDTSSFYINICILNNKHSYQKLHKDIGETVATMYSLLRTYKRKCKLYISIVGFNMDKLTYFANEFNKKRKYRMNGGSNYYESNREQITNKYNSGFDIDFAFRYVNFEKYIGNGFTIQ